MWHFAFRSLREFAKHPLLGGMLALSLLMQGAFQLGSPITLKFIFDEGIGQGKTDILFTALAAWGGLLVLFAIGTFGQEYFNTLLSVRAMNRLRQNIFEKIQELPPNHFQLRSPSEVAGMFSADIGIVETAYVRAMPMFTLQSVVITISVILLFVIEWRLALVTVTSLAVIVILPKMFGQRAKGLGKEYADAGSKVVELAQESATTHAVVRMFGLGEHRLAKFFERLNALETVGPTAHMFTGLVGRTAFIGTGLSQLVVIGVGAIMTIHGYMTTGLLIAFVSLLLRIGDGVSQLSLAIPMILPALTSRERIDAFLNQPVPILEEPGARSMERLTGAVAFYNVTFGYAADTPVLKSLSVTINPGESAAFVGPSGSGKSTVMALLTRVYRPQSGHVMLDGVPIENIKEASLRANMSIVLQAPILFDATIRDNILFGRPESTEAEMIEAAKAAGIHNTIMQKPDGYDTRVSATGGALSGGERQRIATARALLRDAPILLLDEATSALDPASEEIVNRSIAKLAGDKTIVSITHRLASAVNFDRIFVLEKGVLAESGTHQELLAKGGLYASLWQKQHGFSLEVEDGRPSVTAERLALVSFLSQCRHKTLEELARLFLVEHIREGSYVFRQGDDGDRFYIVAHGRLEARIVDAAGQEKVVATLLDGDFFGELALVRNQPRAASIKAVNDSWCLALPRQHFMTLLQSEKTVRDSIAEAVARIQGGSAAKN
jgi:ATP-binding cassette subfamily B protein